MIELGSMNACIAGGSKITPVSWPFESLPVASAALTSGVDAVMPAIANALLFA